MNYTKQTATEINFLASAKYQAFTQQIDDTHAGVVTEAGRKIVPAGSVWPANDGNAKGITLRASDVTDGPQPVAVIVEGYIIEERLPAAVAALAKAELTEIKYR